MLEMRPPLEETALSDIVRIDFGTIPEHAKEDIARVTFDCVKAYLRNPEGKEALEARIAAKKQMAI